LNIKIIRFKIHKTIESAVQSVDLSPIVKDCLYLWKMTPMTKKIESDQRRVEQILFNLLSNAIKFTEKGEVKVECHIIDSRVITQIMIQHRIKPENLEEAIQTIHTA